jgi:CheY-like chemotaxis protein
MSPEVLLHLFEPFFTTKPVGSGTGLGLASVYGIVQQNQGFIRVTSEPGHGTTFELYLPRWIGPRRAHAAQVSAVAPRGRETILLVEDEATLLALGARMLEAQGYTILRAARPTEALRLAADDGVRIDLIVSDVVMPGMSGPDLVAQLRSGWPDLPCLFMSGYPDREVTGSGDHFIGKPFTSADLAVAVRAALDEVRVGSVSPGLSQARLD